MRKLIRSDRLGVDRDATIVCVLTGNGLKDPRTAEAQVAEVLGSGPTTEAVVAALGW